MCGLFHFPSSDPDSEFLNPILPHSPVPDALLPPFPVWNPILPEPIGFEVSMGCGQPATFGTAESAKQIAWSDPVLIVLLSSFPAWPMARTSFGDSYGFITNP